MDLSNINIDLHIERLVLHGFAAGDRQEIGAAVEAELTRLLTAQGLSPSLIAGAGVDRLDVASFDVPAPARPGVVGSKIGQAVYEGMTR